MRKPIMLLAAFLAPLAMAGCGANNTYSPALFGGGVIGDFSITAYNGDPNSVGDGTGRTPNSPNNRANVQWGATRFVTFVLRPLSGFVGGVTVTATPASSPFTSTAPAPSSVYLSSVPSNTSMQFTVVTGTPSQTPGQTTVTATAGSISKTITVYYSAEAPD